MFLELDGKWRFCNDKVWGECLFRFREGFPMLDDIKTININCHTSTKKAPPSIQIATYCNRDHDAINCSIFEQYCLAYKTMDEHVFNGAVIVFMDNLEMENSISVYVPLKSNTVKQYFYSNCGETSIQMDMERCDPSLKLCPGCPLMLTSNIDVPNGIANSTRVSLI